MDLACKLARRHWQLEGRPDKRIILSRDRAYHGLHALGTSVAGLKFNREGYGGDSLVPETRRVHTNDVAGIAAVIAEVGADNIAAIVGVIPPAPGFFARLQELTRANDILLIADEVITGFGRAGTMFACERFDIRPDLLLMAKGITSGYLPMGGVQVSPRIWERFYRDDAPIMRHGLTYSGHATASAAAHVNIDILENEQLVDRGAPASRGISNRTAKVGVREIAYILPTSSCRLGVGLRLRSARKAPRPMWCTTESSRHG